VKKLLGFQVTHMYSFLQHNNGGVGPDSRFETGAKPKYFADEKQGRTGEQPGLSSALMNTHQMNSFDQALISAPMKTTTMLRQSKKQRDHTLHNLHLLHSPEYTFIDGINITC